MRQHTPSRVRDQPTRDVWDRQEVVALEREEHGGIKIGSAFFGFLTAMGTGVLLTAPGHRRWCRGRAGHQHRRGEGDVRRRSGPARSGIVGGIVLLVIVFVAYYCGGYVAGRMARSTARSRGSPCGCGPSWSAILVAVLGAVAGNKYNVLGQLNSFPRIPVNEGDLTTGGVIAAVAAVAASLGGAILGGLAGMRFHRRVDRTGLGR